MLSHRLRLFSHHGIRLWCSLFFSRRRCLSSPTAEICQPSPRKEAACLSPRLQPLMYYTLMDVFLNIEWAVPSRPVPEQRRIHIEGGGVLNPFRKLNCPKSALNLLFDTQNGIWERLRILKNICFITELKGKWRDANENQLSPPPFRQVVD